MITNDYFVIRLIENYIRRKPHVFKVFYFRFHKRVTVEFVSTVSIALRGLDFRFEVLTGVLAVGSFQCRSILQSVILYQRSTALN